VREFPDIEPPTVSISTNYPGAAAAVVETRVPSQEILLANFDPMGQNLKGASITWS
jgi:hypothetical protein